MLGIPGAGKTTFLEIFQAQWGGMERPVLLGFDQVMQAMPDYQAMDDKIAAFAAFELPAREAGYKKLDELIARKQSILFDNGGSAATHIDILKRAQTLGYRIILVSIKTDIAVAQAHVDKRAIIEGRHTPMTYLSERAEKLAALEMGYRALTPYFYEIDNDGQDFAAFQKKSVEVATAILHDLGREGL
jgi:predicted ABC-type ATPase